MYKFVFGSANPDYFFHRNISSSHSMTFVQFYLFFLSFLSDFRILLHSDGTEAERLGLRERRRRSCGSGRWRHGDGDQIQQQVQVDEKRNSEYRQDARARQRRVCDVLLAKPMVVPLPCDADSVIMCRSDKASSRSVGFVAVMFEIQGSFSLDCDADLTAIPRSLLM